MKRFFAPLLLLLAALATPLQAATEEETDDRLVLFEDFETPPFIIRHPLVEAAEGEGVNGSTALRVTYEGFEQGSRRVVRQVPLGERGGEYTLQFDVKFSEDFQFVRGGKLHGLGPSRPITGGHPVRPDGWSARATFAADGEVRTYLYNQDQPGQWGTSQRNRDFHFKRGEYQSVSFHMKINDPEEANGHAHIYVDGELIIRHDNVRFRGEDGDHTLIDRMLFSTFHGGSSPVWAPVDEDGEYTTVYAWFDNFAVWRGKEIRTAPGK